MILEQWKIIPWANEYEISTYGNVRNIVTGKMVRQSPNGSGYLRVTIGGKRWYVHQLMMKVFQNWEPSDGAIKYLDGDRLNNRLDNFEVLDKGRGSQYKGRYVNYTCRTCANRGLYSDCRNKNDMYFCSKGARIKRSQNREIG